MLAHSDKTDISSKMIRTNATLCPLGTTTSRKRQIYTGHLKFKMAVEDNKMYQLQFISVY